MAESTNIETRIQELQEEISLVGKLIHTLELDKKALEKELLRLKIQDAMADAYPFF